MGSIRDAPKLARVLRLDSIPLVKATYTPEGYLEDTPILTSTGIFEYTNPDGSIRRELRLPEEVFKPESLASYCGKPICITHDAGLITKDNVHENAVGTILSEGFRDGASVRAKIIIHDTDENCPSATTWIWTKPRANGMGSPMMQFSGTSLSITWHLSLRPGPVSRHG